MTTLYVTEPRSLVKKDGQTLIVNVPSTDTDPSRKVSVPLHKITQVVIQGDSTLTTPAMIALMEQNTDICFLSYHGMFRGRLAPADGKNGLLRLAQHRAHDDPPTALELARRFIRGKLHNAKTLLLRTNRKRQLESIEAAARSLDNIIKRVDELEGEYIPAENSSVPQEGSTLGTLLGLEGAASAAYFGVFADLFHDDWGFHGRKRRPPTDPINALLSYGYTLLLNHAASACQIVGFDPHIGFLHSTQYGKPALALDIMEEFRAPIVDSVVLSVLNNGILQHDDFDETLGAYHLRDKGRKRFLQKFEERLNAEIKHPVFGYKASYRKCLELQVRLVSKWLMGDIPVYKPFSVR